MKHQTPSSSVGTITVEWQKSSWNISLDSETVMEPYSNLNNWPQRQSQEPEEI